MIFLLQVAAAGAVVLLMLTSGLSFGSFIADAGFGVAVSVLVGFLLDSRKQGWRGRRLDGAKLRTDAGAPGYAGGLKRPPAPPTFDELPIEERARILRQQVENDHRAEQMRQARHEQTWAAQQQRLRAETPAERKARQAREADSVRNQYNARTDRPSGSFPGVLDYSPPLSLMDVPIVAGPEPAWSGDGGSFSGAGASGSFDAPSSPSCDSSSSDSGSCGGGSSDP